MGIPQARSPDFSSFQSKSEASDPSKEGAARRAMGAELAGNGVQCYTLETSFYASHDSEGRLVAYTKERYVELGRNVCRSLVDYYSLGGGGRGKKKGGGGGELVVAVTKPTGAELTHCHCHNMNHIYCNI